MAPPAISDPPPCPPTAPDWFRNGHAEVTRCNLGAHFNALLAAWTRIEAASRFENSAGAITKHLRPEQVNRWIHCGRGRKGRPDMTVRNPAEYGRQWWAWWDTLQPAWRGKDSAGAWLIAGSYGKEWDELMFWGQNGVLSVVASLYFWGCAVQENVELVGDWEVAVNNAAWVCEGLALFHEAFKKRF
ncbi:hypothetical protein C8F04DRAFT_961982 [Mycena alexandri]|uniref:Uncharacterized protein n=1 Tax=Mycena alexandri TaxID=1745969 RepID=A0AAD6SNI8_9AGAR|nr:hypothetical protein C8F04DRAFT_961982 [Mycena alexandri]